MKAIFQFLASVMIFGLLLTAVANADSYACQQAAISAAVDFIYPSCQNEGTCPQNLNIESRALQVNKLYEVTVNGTLSRVATRFSRINNSNFYVCKAVNVYLRLP